MLDRSPSPRAFLSGRANHVRRQMTYTDTTRMVLLLSGVAVLVVAGVVWPDAVPYSAVLVPMYVGSVWLGPRSLPWFIVLSMAGVSAMIAAQPPTVPRAIVRVVVTFVLALMMLLFSFRRSRLGIAGLKGESMLADLRDRIVRQGEIPPLPQDWYARSVLRSAGGTAFAGDFVVAVHADGRLQVALVDVSGKGVEAGTRSLLLSGAFGGLLAGVPPDRFLPAANEFLLRQDWAEGFATAVHLDLDLADGSYVLRTAGHPPAILLQAGAGEWRALGSDGPVLGLLPDAVFTAVQGTLTPGDALMLYTDGLVEDPREDIGVGIDRLGERAVDLLRTGLEGAETTLVDELERTDDDRALLLVQRR